MRRVSRDPIHSTLPSNANDWGFGAGDGRRKISSKCFMTCRFAAVHRGTSLGLRLRPKPRRAAPTARVAVRGAHDSRFDRIRKDVGGKAEGQFVVQER